MAAKKMPTKGERKERILRNLDKMTPAQRANLGQAMSQVEYPQRKERNDGRPFDTTEPYMRKLKPMRDRLEYEGAGGMTRGHGFAAVVEPDKKKKKK